MWDLSAAAAAPRARARSHRFGVSALSFYPGDAGLFVSGSHDKTVQVWDAREMAPAFTFALDAGVHAARMAPRAQHSLVAAACAVPQVRLLDLRSGACTHSLAGHIGEARAVAWSPRDEFLLASGGCDGAARLWDIRMAASCLASLDMDGADHRPALDPRNRAHQGKPGHDEYRVANGGLSHLTRQGL